jgi:hypothetical protein
MSVLIASAAVPLKNREGLGGPGDVVRRSRLSQRGQAGIGHWYAEHNARDDNPRPDAAVEITIKPR